MFNLCPGCGVYEPEKAVEAGGPIGWEAVCPACGHRHPFKRLPLVVLTGASGADREISAAAKGTSALAVVSLPRWWG